MRCLPGVLAFLVPLTTHGQWKPPADPDPQAIRSEARADTRAGRYEDALAKHVWYHHNALKYTPSLGAVRLSYALRDWQRLGQVYPPALVKLKAIRDEVTKTVKEGKNVSESFRELRAINKRLGEEIQTKDVFVALDKHNPEAAKEVYRLAQPALIKAKSYELCDKYIDAKNAFPSILARFERSKELAEDPRIGARHLEFGQNRFTNETTTLVAILIINGHMAEAHQIVVDAKKAWEDETFHTAIDRAFMGHVPDPWP